MKAELSFSEYLKQTDALAKTNLEAFASCAAPMARALAWAGEVIDQGSTETPQEYLERVARRVATQDPNEDIGAYGDNNPGWGNMAALRAAVREGY